MATDTDINVVFIIGSGRSGSSLIHELISRHHDIGFISNVDDNFPFANLKGTFNNLLFRSPLGNFTKKGRPRFAPSEAYHLISRKVSPIYRNSCRNLRAEDVTPKLRAAFRQFFVERYRAQGKRVFVHKYTGWSRIGFFREIFPEARFIHIVRDGRAVANSFLQMDWWTGYLGPERWYLGSLQPRYRSKWQSSDRSFLTLAGIAWEILVSSVEEDAAAVADDVISTVRYEDFLDRPVDVMRDLCAFAGLEFDQKFADRMRASEVYSKRKQAFLKDLSPAQVEELTDCIAATLDTYGYLDGA